MEVHYNILIFAFRYALGRMSMAPSTVMEELKKHWDELPETSRNQIQNEIRQAIETDSAGMECDVKLWEELLR